MNLGARASCPHGLSRVEFLGEMSGFFPRVFPLIPPTPFSHKGRRGILGFLMPKTGEGTQEFPPKPAPVSPRGSVERTMFSFPDGSHRCMRARRPRTHAVRRRAPFQRARNIPERLKQ